MKFLQRRLIAGIGRLPEFEGDGVARQQSMENAFRAFCVELL
jgi:hypothetical protein